MRTGDHVYHRPTRQNWIVAYADHATGKIAACDPHIGEGRIVDCDLIRAATEDEHIDLLAELEIAGDPRGIRASEIAKRELAEP